MDRIARFVKRAFPRHIPRPPFPANPAARDIHNIAETPNFVSARYMYSAGSPNRNKLLSGTVSTLYPIEGGDLAAADPAVIRSLCHLGGVRGKGLPTWHISGPFGGKNPLIFSARQGALIVMHGSIYGTQPYKNMARMRMDPLTASR